MSTPPTHREMLSAMLLSLSSYKVLARRIKEEEDEWAKNLVPFIAS